MTNEEAIRLLTYDETISRLIPDYDFYNKMRLQEVRQIAVSALEKQIPKKGKTIIEGKPENGGCYGVRICPVCDKRIDVYGDYKGCPYCLQAIDWSAEE